MEVRWTAPAAQDLENIASYIQRENPTAARRMARTLYDAAMSLGTYFPIAAVQGELTEPANSCALRTSSSIE